MKLWQRCESAIVVESNVWVLMAESILILCFWHGRGGLGVPTTNGWNWTNVFERWGLFLWWYNSVNKQQRCFFLMLTTFVPMSYLFISGAFNLEQMGLICLVAGVQLLWIRCSLWTLGSFLFFHFNHWLCSKADEWWHTCSIDPCLGLTNQITWYCINPVYSSFWTSLKCHTNYPHAVDDLWKSILNSHSSTIASQSSMEEKSNLLHNISITARENLSRESFITHSSLILWLTPQQLQWWTFHGRWVDIANWCFIWYCLRWQSEDGIICNGPTEMGMHRESIIHLVSREHNT